MKTRANTSCETIDCRLRAIGKRSGCLRPRAYSLQAGFTLVEMLVVIAIIALVIAALMPAMGSFFDSARGPNARNLISVSLTNARNYAVANNITTALVFVEDDDPSGSPRRTLMFFAESSNGVDFTPVPGRETTHLPDEIIISDDNVPDDPEAPAVAICFLPSGQLFQTTSINQITMPDPPGGADLTNADVSSVTSFYLYDSLDSDSPVEELLINYYTGAVIE